MSKNNLNYSVYVHTNKINGKKYVGQSSNIIERWKNGGKNYFSSTKFHRAIQKYGWENFTHEILYENLNKEAANKADYYGSSITDERHFALYIKDTIDDEDAGDGTTMRRWYATMVANGTMVDWEDVI